MDDLRNIPILVTGGTGFIGTSLCEALAARGARVFVLTRGTKRDTNKAITYISSLSAMDKAEPEIIINLAGEPIAQRWTASAKEKISKSRIDITASLIDYIKSATKKPSLFISASAIGYYGTDKNREFDETITPLNSNSLFSSQLCAAWEAEALKANQYGVRTVLLRIGAVLEKNGGILAKLMPSFRAGLGGTIGDGQQWLSWIDRDDLVSLVFHIMRTSSIKGPINATAPNPVTNKIFSETLAEILGRPCFFRTPAPLLRLVFGGMANEIMLAGQKVLPSKAIETGFVFSYPSIKSSLQKILKL